MKELSVLFFLIILLPTLPAQIIRDNRYEEYMSQGKHMLNRGEYKEAVDNFILARYCLEADPQDSQPDYYLELTLNRWTTELDSARQAQKELLDIEKRTTEILRIAKEEEEKARKEAEANRVLAETEKERAERGARIIYGFYVSEAAEERLERQPPATDDALHLAYLAIDTLRGSPYIPASVRERFGAAVWAKYGQVQAAHRGGILQLTQHDNRLVTVGRDSVVKVMDLDGQALLTTPRHADYVLFATLDDNGQYLLTACRNGNAYLWPISGTPFVTLRGDGSPVMKAGFLPNGDQIAGITDAGNLHIWDRQGRSLSTPALSDAGPLRDLQIRDETILVRSAREAFAWPAGNNSVLHRLEPEGALILSADISPEGRWILLTTDRGILLWDWRSDRTRPLHEGERSYSGSFHPNAATVTVGDENGQVYNWPMNGGTASQVVQSDQPIVQIQYAEDGAVQARTRSEIIWMAEDRSAIPLQRHQTSITASHLSADGRFSATGAASGNVKLWSQEGEILLSLNMGAAITGVQLTPDGQYLIAGAEDGDLAICPNPVHIQQQFQSGDRSLPILSSEAQRWMNTTLRQLNPEKDN